MTGPWRKGKARNSFGSSWWLLSKTERRYWSSRRYASSWFTTNRKIPETRKIVMYHVGLTFWVSQDLAARIQDFQPGLGSPGNFYTAYLMLRLYFMLWLLEIRWRRYGHLDRKWATLHRILAYLCIVDVFLFRSNVSSERGQSHTFVHVIKEIRLRRVNFIQITSGKRNIYFLKNVKRPTNWFSFVNYQKDRGRRVRKEFVR